MAPKLYYLLASPPVRAVLLCAKELGIDLDLEEVDIVQKKQLKPEYLKINSLHPVPTLVDDDGFVVCDSHVIMAYLIGKYGNDKSSLYPADIKKRATIDQRLHFDTGILFARGLLICKSLLNGIAKDVSKPYADGLVEAYGFVETFLENSTYVAGEQLTIADFSIVASITTWDVYVPVDASKYPKITTWIKRLESLPYYEDINKPGLEAFKNLVGVFISA